MAERDLKAARVQGESKDAERNEIELGYAGRHELKGIHAGQPYPVFFLNRDGSKQPDEDRMLGLQMTCQDHPTAIKFIRSFFQDRGNHVRPPFIVGCRDKELNQIPPDMVEARERMISEDPVGRYEDAANRGDPTTPRELPQDRIVSEIENSTPANEQLDDPIGDSTEGPATPQR